MSEDKKSYFNRDSAVSDDGNFSAEGTGENTINAENSLRPYELSIHLPSNDPIVVLFGPPEVGKTVALLRLTAYLQKHGFAFPISNATPNEGSFQIAKQNFQEVMNRLDSGKPPRTREIDFLLLEARHRSKLNFHILEASGEHFFDRTEPQKQTYPRYMSQIFKAPTKKVYVIFFEENMFGSSDLRKFYANRLSHLINAHVDIKRDKIIVLYNKINNNLHRFQSGKTALDEIYKEVFQHSDYIQFSNSIMANGGKLKHVPLVPFYSGDFYEDAWSMSEDHYPQKLYDAINRSLRKRFF
ncbi:MAG: hypothetical protein AAFO03_00480 [Bacteroidota bacterium]